MTKKGFTLIELLITVVIMAALVGVFSASLTVGFKSWVSGNNRGIIMQSCENAMKSMARDITLATSFTAASATGITFTADVDNDSILETVSLGVVSGALMRTVNGTAVTLAPDVGSITFGYLKAGNIAFVPAIPADQTNRDLIKNVNITLAMTKTNETFSLNSSVYCRNRP